MDKNEAYNKIVELGMFDKFQLEQIKLGIFTGLSVATYANPDYSVEKMRFIREGLEEGFDFTQYVDYDFDEGQIELIKKGYRAGISKDSIDLYAMPYFNEYQMEQILDGFIYNTKCEDGNRIPVDVYAKPEYDSDQMYEILTGLISNVDVYKYADANIPAKDMRGIREDLELKKKLDSLDSVITLMSIEQNNINDTETNN